MADLYQPAIPARLRTGVYVAGLVVATLSIVAPDIAAEFAPEQIVESVGNICDTLVRATAFLAGALSVVYRPTRTANERTPEDAS